MRLSPAERWVPWRVTRGLARGARGALVGLGVIVLLLGVVWVAGGFRETVHSLPEAGVGASIDLGRYAITVDDVYLTDRDDAGKPLTDDADQPKRRLVVDVTMEMMDVDAGTVPRPSGPDALGRVVLIQSGVDPWVGLPSDSGDGPRDDLQPGVPTKVAYWFTPAEVVPRTVRVTLASQDYGWTNLINGGPDWSSVAVPAVVVTDVPVADRTKA